MSDPGNALLFDVEQDGDAFDDPAYRRLLGLGEITTSAVTTKSEGDVMPWHVVQGAAACGGGWAVVKDDTGEIAGCHDGRAEAVAQLRALYAAESDTDLPGCPPGEHRMPDGSCMPDEAMSGELWHAVAHREGISTGQRVWLPDSISWRPPPFALHWEYSSAAHGGQMMTVHVGNVTRMVRVGDEIHAWGNIDLDGADGHEFARKLVSGFARGVSMGPGSETIIYDLVWPEGMTAEQQIGAEPDQVVFRDYKIGELTAVSVPAQEGAYIAALPALVEAMSWRGVTVASAVGAHDTGTSDEPWDKGVNERRLPSPMSVSTARKFYAWIDNDRVENGQIPKDGGKFPHHFVSDGGPTAASTAACSAGLGRLKGSVDIPEDQRRGVYNHLRSHLVASGREPDSIPSFEAVITTAGGSWTVDIPDLPPAWWFDEPTDCTPAAAVTVTDEGRIFGYLAPANIAHRSHARNGVRKTVASLGRTDYSRWLKETIVEGGGRVLAGPVTMECMHAPTQAYGTLDRRHQHYEDSCAIVARVAIGDNRHGRWIAGALMPGLTPEQITKLMMCDVSLDSQPHPERPGWQDFVAVLAVPVGGWPKARTETSVPVTRIRETGDELIVTASAVPIRYTASPAVIDPAVMHAIAARGGV